MKQACLTAALMHAASAIALLAAPAAAWDLKALFVAGVDLYHHRQYHASLRAMQEVLGVQPNFKEALIVKARCLLRLDEPQQAVITCDRVLSIDKKSVEALLLRSEAFIAQEQLEPSLADCQRALSLQPGQAAYHLHGKLMMMKGDYAKAALDFEKAIKCGPQDASILISRAECFMHLRKYAQCVDDCTSALKMPQIDTDDIGRAYRDRAKAYEKLGKPELARQDRKRIDQMTVTDWGPPP